MRHCNGFARLALAAFAALFAVTSITSAQSTPPSEGTAQLIWEGWNGEETVRDYFDFSEGYAMVDTSDAIYVPDLNITSNEGANFGVENTSIPGPRYQLLGTGTLADVVDGVVAVPEYTGAQPWVSNSWDFEYGTMGSPVSADQLWAVYTREGNYAVMQITSVGDTTTSFTFDYMYQTDGTRDFSAGTGGGGGGTGANPFYVDYTMPDDGEVNARLNESIFIYFTEGFDAMAFDVSTHVEIIGDVGGTYTSPTIGQARYTDHVELTLTKGATWAPGENVTVTVLASTPGADTTLGYDHLFTFTVADTTGGMVSGQGLMLSNMGGGFYDGQWFDFSEGIVSDTSAVGMDITYTENEGVNFSAANEGVHLRRLDEFGSLGEVDNFDAYSLATDTLWGSDSWQSNIGTGGMPLSMGEVWAVHTLEGN